MGKRKVVAPPPPTGPRLPSGTSKVLDIAARLEDHITEENRPGCRIEMRNLLRIIRSSKENPLARFTAASILLRKFTAISCTLGPKKKDDALRTKTLKRVVRYLKKAKKATAKELPFLSALEKRNSPKRLLKDAAILKKNLTRDDRKDSETPVDISKKLGQVLRGEKQNWLSALGQKKK